MGFVANGKEKTTKKTNMPGRQVPHQKNKQRLKYSGAKKKEDSANVGQCNNAYD